MSLKFSVKTAIDFVQQSQHVENDAVQGFIKTIERAFERQNIPLRDDNGFLMKIDSLYALNRASEDGRKYFVFFSESGELIDCNNPTQTRAYHSTDTMSLIATFK